MIPLCGTMHAAECQRGFSFVPFFYQGLKAWVQSRDNCYNSQGMGAIS
jgi:hypothetical protein